MAADPQLTAVLIGYDSNAVASPSPLVKSLNEGVAWTTDNVITITDSDSPTVTIVENAGSKPAWVGVAYSAGAPNYTVPATITFSGTPPMTGAGSAGSYSWNYDVSDGTTTINVIVNLTVVNVNQAETLSVEPASPYACTVAMPIVDVTLTGKDPDGGSNTLRLVSGSLPPGITINRALPYTAAVPYTATIIGTPSSPGTYTIVYENDDGEGSTDQETLVFNVVAGPGPSSMGHFKFGTIRPTPGGSLR